MNKLFGVASKMMLIIINTSRTCEGRKPNENVFHLNSRSTARRKSGGLGTSIACIVFLIFGLALAGQVRSASLFGGNDKAANVKVTNGGEIKGKTKVAIGAFRVAFVTEDAVSASTSGVFGGAATKITAALEGLDRDLMQKIADEIYADFLKQAATKGYTVIDSASLATLAPAYAALAPSDNFTVGRLGTFVIPTGQRSVALAADSRGKDEKGTAGFAARFAIVSDQVAKTPAYDAFPTAAKQSDAIILAVTVVANFADFKGSASFGGAKASINVGPTVDGRTKNEIIPATAILGWSSGTGGCPFCQAQVSLEGQIHSEAPIGAYKATAAEKNWAGNVTSQSGSVTVDPPAYEKGILDVASQAVNLLLSAAMAEK